MINADDVINICPFKDVFPPLNPLVIDQNDLFMTHLSWSMDWDLRTQTEAAALLLK